MALGNTPSEKFVTSLCERSFLRLWSHPNPSGKKGKELCDCLVVCGPHIIIISVKENDYKNTDNKTGWDRWRKAAIEKSVSQIWGAERWLETVDEIVHHDGRKITLPRRADRQYHRLSVSLGSKGQVPLQMGDFGNGFVHVCDEYSVNIVFGVLDTITDFVEFMKASETLVRNGVNLMFSGGGIEDLLALYLMNGRSFNFKSSKGQPDTLILLDDLWKGFSNSSEFAAIQNDLRDSYIWDHLIEYYSGELLADRMLDMHSKEVTSNELALSIMALQPRMDRALLARSFIDFLQNINRDVASRAVKGYAETAFVFFAGKDADRELRVKELSLRCLVIRGRLRGVKTVVGIATDRTGTSEVGYSSDIAYIHIPEWTSEDEAQVIGIQDELGYFRNI